jgi:hypothetical protein
MLIFCEMFIQTYHRKIFCFSPISLPCSLCIKHFLVVTMRYVCYHSFCCVVFVGHIDTQPKTYKSHNGSELNDISFYNWWSASCLSFFHSSHTLFFDFCLFVFFPSLYYFSPHILSTIGNL